MVMVEATVIRLQKVTYISDKRRILPYYPSSVNVYVKNEDIDLLVSFKVFGVLLGFCNLEICLESPPGSSIT